MSNRTNRSAISRRTVVRRQRLVAQGNLNHARTPAPAAAAAPVTQDPPPPPWRNSEAKKQLIADIISGETDKYSGPSAVYLSRPIYQLYIKQNFLSNYYSLRQKHATRKLVAAKARQATNHDTKLINAYRIKQGTFHYNGSDLQKQLRKDVREGLTNGKTPKQVRNSRPTVYNKPGQLTLQQFANHLWHERRRLDKNKQADNYHERMEFIPAKIKPTNQAASSTSK